MNIQDMLSSALVAAIVSGILVFSYQQWFQQRMRRLEARFEQERSYRQQSNELLVSAYRKIWAGLIDIEYWLKHELWDEVQSKTTVTPEQWSIFHDTYKNFRAEMLFLPDPIYDRTLNLILQLEANSNRFLDALRQVIAMKEKDPEGYATNPELIQVVNSAMDVLCGDYRSGLDELRRDYQTISRDLLLASGK